MEGNTRSFMEIPLSMVAVSGNNLRKNFDNLNELVASVRILGVLEPILVRPLCPEPSTDGPGALGRYELVAGERRFRAASAVAEKNGGLENYRIPAMVQEMSDDEAFDVMTIENLQREDLTELEEARGFQIYLDRKGIEALPTLAERTGIDVRYIRRRLAVLDLPEEALDAWERGKVAYGHLEQLTRLKDPGEQKKFFRTAVDRDIPVARFKTMITENAPPLKTARFDKEAVGCNTCHNNTSIQRKLFGADVANTGGQCLGPACYKKHQAAWLTDNWPAFREKQGLPPTNGYRFHEEVNWEQRKSLYGAVKTQCRECADYVSIIQMDAGDPGPNYKQVCIGDKKCYKALYESTAKPTFSDGKKPDPNAPRVAWHGRFFREAHYKERLPLLEASLPNDDPRILRIILMTLLEGAKIEILDSFALAYDPKNKAKERWEQYGTVRAWLVIEGFDAATLMRVLRETAVKVLLDGLNLTNNDYIRGATGASIRHLVACHLGGDLLKDWVITKDYLEKKTIVEIKAIAEKFGIFKEAKAQAFLYETLGKKRDAFGSCKKSELIRIILESGVDLTGKVPAEILNAGKEA